MDLLYPHPPSASRKSFPAWIGAKQWKRSLIMSISTVLHEMNYKTFCLGISRITTRPKTW